MTNFSIMKIMINYNDGSPKPSVDLPHLEDGNDSGEVVVPDVAAEVENPLPEELKEEEPLPNPSTIRSREAEAAEEQRPYKKVRWCRGLDDSSINTDNGGNGPLRNAVVDAVSPEEAPPPGPSRRRSREKVSWAR